MTRVLIIDDDLEVRDQVATTLLAAYYESYTAVDGRDGVTKALHYQPDLIICDMTMPNMNGQQVIAELRQHPETASVPFIFLTAIDDRNTVRESMNLGADDYLFKPLQVNELLKTVSARLKHHQQIVATAEQQIEVIKERLTRTITHELRTPVGLVLNSLELLKLEGDVSSPAINREMIETMSHGANRLAHCVEQMVCATYLTTGVYSNESIATNGYPTEIGGLIAAAHKLARQFTIRQTENVQVKITELKEPLYVHASPTPLKQAIAELISNGLSYSPPDSTVRVVCKRVDNDVRISITDSGRGIPDKQLKEALSWYGQVDREIHEQQGMGMGLPLADQLIAIHGGTLDIHSIVDKGTQAVITLPLTSVA